MEVQQVFSSNQCKTGDSTPGYTYCPHCREKLVPFEEGGRPRQRCPKCGFVHYQNPFPGAVVLIEQDQQILLGRRAPGNYREGLWCLPGGFIEFDEDFLTAAIREVKEETSLDIEIRSIISVVSNFFSPMFHTLVVVLLARILRGSPRAGDDIEAVEWFPLAGPLPEMAFLADRHIIERYWNTNLEGAPVDSTQTFPRDDW